VDRDIADIATTFRGHRGHLPGHLGQSTGISVNELDPLRDEGIAHYQKLKRAGVAVAMRTVAGACHLADTILPAQMPDAYHGMVASIHDFVESR
jgi:acetyl esterase/lipase